MRRRTMLAVSGMAMASIAGCSSNGDGDTESVDDAETDNGTDDAETDNGTDDGESDDLEEMYDGEFPDGFGERGIMDYEVALGSESAYYNDLDSFTCERDVTEIFNGDEREQEIVGWASGGEEFSYTHERHSDTTRVERYTSPSDMLERAEYPDGEVLYDVISRGFDRRFEYFIDQIEFLVDGFEFEAHAVPEGDRGDIEYRRSVQPGEDAYEESESMEVVDGDGVTLTIDEDGIPVRLIYDFEIEGDNDMELTQSATIEWDDYNESVSEEPEWLGEAIEESRATDEMFGR